MADTLGCRSNHWTAFFDALEDWEAILQSLPDDTLDDGDPPT
ncbi:MAG: hypothetical protein ABJM43_22155 [Paracoccaceae bacterium]